VNPDRWSSSKKKLPPKKPSNIFTESRDRDLGSENNFLANSSQKG